MEACIFSIHSIVLGLLSKNETSILSSLEYYVKMAAANTIAKSIVVISFSSCSQKMRGLLPNVFHYV